MVFDNSYSTQPTELAYDLRQIYAKLVGEHMIDIAEARKADQFYTWYKALEDLHTIIKHKFKSKDKDEKDYNTTMDKVTKLANKFPTAWLGKNSNNNERSLIEEALRQLEEFLYDRMNDAKMFGESGRIAGL
jgi:hypothetical protein